MQFGLYLSPLVAEHQRVVSEEIKSIFFCEHRQMRVLFEEIVAFFSIPQITRVFLPLSIH